MNDKIYIQSSGRMLRNSKQKKAIVVDIITRPLSWSLEIRKENENEHS
jgi:superfamily II DNA or RNA helicase